MDVETQQQQNRHGGARANSGRPRFEPTDEERKQVEAMAGYGVGESHIAALIRGGIGLSTLRERFKEDLERGRAKAHAGIGKTLYQKAMAGDVASLIWWTKTQMRWAEQPKVIEISGQISITQALEEAAQRVIEAEIVEVDEPLQLANEPSPVVDGGNIGGNIEDDDGKIPMKSSA